MLVTRTTIAVTAGMTFLFAMDTSSTSAKSTTNRVVAVRCVQDVQCVETTNMGFNLQLGDALRSESVSAIDDAVRAIFEQEISMRGKRAQSEPELAAELVRIGFEAGARDAKADLECTKIECAALRTALESARAEIERKDEALRAMLETADEACSGRECACSECDGLTVTCVYCAARAALEIK